MLLVFVFRWLERNWKLLKSCEKVEKKCLNLDVSETMGISEVGVAIFGVSNMALFLHIMSNCHQS